MGMPKETANKKTGELSGGQQKLSLIHISILGNLIYYGMMFGRGEVMKEYMMSNANMNATIVEYVNGCLLYTSRCV